MAYTLAAPFVRVFYNKGDNRGKIWSIDFGPDTPELVVSDVTVATVGHTGFIQTPNVECPRAWIEFTDTTVSIDVERNTAAVYGAGASQLIQ